MAKSDKDQTIKDIASAPLTYNNDPNLEDKKNIYLQFEEYLKEYETKKQINLSETYPGLVEDIRLWVKFSSLYAPPPP